MQRALCLLFLVVLAGCASQQDLNSLKWEVDALNTRLAKTEQQFKEKERVFNQTMSQQADLLARYTEIQDQLFSIQGRLDEMQMSTGTGTDGSIQARIGALEQDIQAVKGSIGKAPVPVKSSYETGVELFRASRYEDAIADLKSYLGKNPDPSLIDNAHFWIGESYYALGKYDDAILRYELVVKEFSSSEKVPECLLKQGLSFIKMGDKQTGELILEQLISGYSNTDAAAKAKKIIKDGDNG